MWLLEAGLHEKYGPTLSQWMQPQLLFHSQLWRCNEENMNHATLNREVLHMVITFFKLFAFRWCRFSTYKQRRCMGLSLFKFSATRTLIIFRLAKTKRGCVKLNVKKIQFHTLRDLTASFDLFESHKDAVEPHRNSCPVRTRCCSMDNSTRCGRVCCMAQLRMVSFRDVFKGICCSRMCWGPVHLTFHWVDIGRSNGSNYGGYVHYRIWVCGKKRGANGYICISSLL